MKLKATLSAPLLFLSRSFPIMGSSGFHRLGLWRYTVAATALVALADWLFWEQSLGISLAMFLSVGLAVAMAINPSRGNLRGRIIALVLAAVSLTPLIEALNPLSLLFAVAGVLLALLRSQQRLGLAFNDLGSRYLRFIVAASLRPIANIKQVQHYRRRKRAAKSGDMKRSSAAIGWIIPIAFGAVFFLLFTNANPLLEDWLGSLELANLIGPESIYRLGFWLMIAYLIWPFLRPRLGLKRRTKSVRAAQTPTVAGWSELFRTLFSTRAIFRSLLLFNLLFAGQSIMDIAYLWGGVTLPVTMSYADYAHRGAYPLVLTALLAAVFVLIALRPGSDSEKSFVIRGLVYAWIGQNIFLVASAILRLDLYVEIYALTYLRVAAFIWMFLVALGLFFILVRILQRRSGGWLVRVNMVSLLATLYLCSLINFTDFVATYNVDHSEDVGAPGAPLDIFYLGRLGPAALPALDRYIALRRDQGRAPSHWAHRIRNRLLGEHVAMASNWRSWSFRNARISAYLVRSRSP